MAIGRTFLREGGGGEWDFTKRFLLPFLPNTLFRKCITFVPKKRGSSIPDPLSYALESVCSIVACGPDISFVC